MKDRIKLKCKTCSTVWSVSPCYKHRKYCSPNCYYESKFKPKLKIKCLQCKKIWYVRPSSKNAKFCSKKCMYKYFKKHKISSFYNSEIQRKNIKKVHKLYPNIGNRTRWRKR